ncbi:MAG: LysM peptidoglycan-binding domain-containing protein [Pedobacter sp.]|nr:MAG: LysM peptidoglycan-binding domain-containing protein [Pedobacter sp.]
MKTSLLSVIILNLLFLSACKTAQYSRNNKQIQKEAQKQNPTPLSYTTLSYIETFKTVAISEMNKNGIPASITLAQGILESGSGNSELAKYANNHFGIKCTQDWKGKSYYKTDDKANECFRVYTDAQESFKDHSEFLKRKRYSALFELDKNDYKNWAKGLKAAGYATNPQYADLLINLIEKYNLHQYDSPDGVQEKLNREDRIFTEINKDIPNEAKKFTPVNKDQGNSTNSNPSAYIVKSGDTLFGLAKRFNITIEEIKTWNNLSDNNIKIGQKLNLKKP